MSKKMEKLDLKSIEKVAELLHANNFRPVDQFKMQTITAELINELSDVLGCSRNYAVNTTIRLGVDGEDDVRVPGSNMFAAVMYQNTLLAKRIAELEKTLQQMIN